MSRLPGNQLGRVETADCSWSVLYRIGGAAALLQLVCTLVIMVVAMTLGAKPGTAEEYFTVLQQDRLTGILRDDFTSLVIISLFLVTIACLYAALRRVHCVWVTLATAFAFVAISICLASHSGFSMLHLSDQYAVAATDAERSQLLAAGEAVIASDMWNSTAGFMAGLLLQGACVMISIVMLRSEQFGKVTAYAGILANGIDLAHHVIIVFMPVVGHVLLVACGPFYLLWFPLLGRDLFRLGRPDPGAPAHENKGTILAAGRAPRLEENGP